MDYEQKILLLKDLCARLPYGVRVKQGDWEHTLESANMYNGSFDSSCAIPIPYLRPMSSMTEDEKKEFNDTFNGFFQYFNHGIISDSRVWDRNEAVFVGELSCSRLIDWLNEHHFDYRRTPDGKTMIEAGLALEAPEGMYKTE